MYAPSYASARFPEPRPFQHHARGLLREGFVAGHRCQMVMAPTGSGKTILAIFLIQEALLRAKRARVGLKTHGWPLPLSRSAMRMQGQPT